MSVPTLTAISPIKGWSAGRDYVSLTGTNFRLPPAPPSTGKTSGKVPQTILVTFGGKVGTKFKVYSTTSASCLTPIHDAGTVDVVLTNLDDNGVPIPGETATLTAAYTFARPDLAVESDFLRVSRALIREIKRQVLSNVSFTVHTDYSTTPNPTRITEVAALPALVLTGPEVSENRFFSKSYEDVVQNGAVYDIRRIPYTVDLEYNITGLSSLTQQLENLQAVTMQFFHRNKYLIMDRDASDSTKGTVSYELDFLPGTEPKVIVAPNESNLRSFHGRIAIKGIDLEDIVGFGTDMVIDETKEISTITTDTQSGV